jgi:hypothetical protein
MAETQYGQYEHPLDIALGLRELAAFIGSCGFSEAAQLVDEAAEAAWKQITPILDRIDRQPRRPQGG